jgi:hypothetical protein
VTHKPRRAVAADITQPNELANARRSELNANP